MRRVLVILSFSLCFNALIAQSLKTCPEIQANPDFFSASSVGKTEQEAQITARTLLVQQISSLVTSRTDMTIVAGNTSSEQTFTNLSKAVSNLRLDGLKFERCREIDGKKSRKKNEDDGIWVLCYISKADFNRSAEKVASTVRDYLQLYAQKRDLGLDGLSDLYVAYLYSHLTPKPIEFYFGRDTISNVKPYLEAQLRSHLSDIEILCSKVEEHPQYPDDQIRLTLDVKGGSTSDLTYRLECSSINASTQITNGNSQFDILMQPSSSNESFNATITLGTMVLPEELASIQEAVTVTREVSFNADMSPIIKIDFNMESTGEYLKLIPEFKHLSISAFEWFSNGKRFSTEQLPKVSKNDVGTKVTLKLNRNAELSVTKDVSTSLSTKSAKTLLITNPSDASPSELLTKKSNTKSAGEVSGSDVEWLSQFESTSSFAEVQQKLKSLKNQGGLVYGKKSNFMKPEKCAVLLVNPSTKRLEYILTPEIKGSRTEIKENKSYDNFESQLKGYVAIWLERY